MQSHATHPARYDNGVKTLCIAIHQQIHVAEDAFIMQRRDGEVMISFFKAAVNHLDEESSKKPHSPESLDHGIVDTVVDSEKEKLAGHPKAASKLLNKSDRLAQEVSFSWCPFQTLEHAIAKEKAGRSWVLVP